MADYAAFQAVPKFDILMERVRTAGAPLKYQADLVRDFFDDIKTLGFDAANARWLPRLPECNVARIDLARFVEAIEPLCGLPGLKKRILEKVLPWPITQDFTMNEGKPIFYEAEVASALQATAPVSTLS